MGAKIKKAQVEKKQVTRNTKYMDELKARGIDRKSLDFKMGVVDFYDSKFAKFHASSAKDLMEVILNSIAGSREADNIIMNILYPPK